MKTLKKLILLTAVFALLLSCSKPELVGFDNSSDLNSRKKNNSETIFLVEPNGFDDTENLRDAFDEAILYGAGAVVQLVEGEYFLGFIEIRDFYGTFKGAGKGKTFITTLNNLDGQAMWDQNIHADLVKFVGGDVLLSHFTIQTPPGKVSVTGPAKGHIRSLINFSATNANYEAGNENRSINVVIDNVSFKGQFLEGGPGYNYGYNCYFGVRTGYDYFDGSDIPREKIDFKITNSEINTFVYGLVLEGMKNSKLIVGEKNQGNVFSNLDQGGTISESRNMEILIEGNTFNIPEFSWGLDLDNYPWYSNLKEEPQIKASLYTIQNNVFNLNHSEYALLMHDVRRVTNPGEMPLVFQVKNNQFNMTADDYDWSIVSRRTKGLVILNNKFSGQGDLAIYCDSPYGHVYSEDGLILGNNFSAAELGWGAVYLSPDTRNWTIVGGDLGASVLDYGVNNLITGFNNNTSEVHIGQDISDKLKEMKILMHDLKGH